MKPLILNLTDKASDMDNSAPVLERYDLVTSEGMLLTSYASDHFVELYDMIPDDREFYFFVHACAQGKKYHGFTQLQNVINKRPELKGCIILVYSSSPLEPGYKANLFNYRFCITDSLNLPQETILLDHPKYTKLQLREAKYLYPKTLEINLANGKEYYRDSYSSNIKKARKVLEKVHEYIPSSLENFGFVSLGGGSGTELLYEVEMTNAKYGHLTEYSSDSVDIFKEITAGNDRYTSREMDLFDKSKFEFIRSKIRERNLEGVVVTIHAVVHELFTRSQLKEEFKLDEFFKEIYDLHERVFLIIREPGISELWPETVKLHVGDKQLPKFKEWLGRVRRDFFPEDKYEYTVTDEGGTKYFSLHKDLAIESLTKLFYDEDYEAGEKVSFCSHKKIASDLVKVGFTILEIDAMDSDSVYKNFKDNQVKVYDPVTNLLLPFPKCFTYTVAEKNIMVR